MESISDHVLNIISDYGVGINFLNLALLNKESYKSWPLKKETSLENINTIGIANSIQICGKTYPMVTIRCMSVYANEFEIGRVLKLRDHLPVDYAIGTFNFIDNILDIGSFFAIRFFLFQYYTESSHDYSKSIIKFVEKRQVNLVELLFNFYNRDSKDRISDKVGNICLSHFILVGDKEGADIVCTVFKLKGRFVLDGSVISRVVKRNLDIFKWLVNAVDIEEFDEKYVKYFALSGNVQALQYIHSMGVSCSDSSICILVSTRGFLDVLKYLVLDMGVEMDRHSCIHYSRKYPKIVEWINSL